MNHYISTEPGYHTENPDYLAWQERSRAREEARFNETLKMFGERRQRSAQIRQLINIVNSHNARSETRDFITIEGDMIEHDGTRYITNISTDNPYLYEVELGTNIDGRVYRIYVTVFTITTIMNI